MNHYINRFGFDNDRLDDSNFNCVYL